MVSISSSEPDYQPVEGNRQGEVSWWTETGQWRRAVVEVQDTYREGVVVQTLEPLTCGQTVYWKSGQVEHKARVHHCERRGERRVTAFLVFLSIVRHDNRREDRLPTIGRGTLVCFERGRQTLSVQVTNTSTRGAQLEIDRSVPVDQMVRLSGESFEVLGRVQYCQRHGAKFVVGIQFTRPPYPKGSADFRG